MVPSVKDVIFTSKFLAAFLKKGAPEVGFTVITYESPYDQLNMLHIRNLSPLTLHGFTCTIQKGENGAPTPLPFVYLNQKDVFGKDIELKITIPKQGIYMYPNVRHYIYFRDLQNLHMISPDDDLRLKFTYIDPNGKQRKSSLQHIVRARANVQSIENNSIEN